MISSPASHHPHFGMSDTGDYRKPTIVQIVYWKQTGPLNSLVKELNLGRIDVTAPMGDRYGIWLSLQMIERAMEDIKESNYVFNIFSKIIERLRLKNISNLEIKNDEHDVMQVVYYPHTGSISGQGEVDIIGLPKENKILSLNMLERARCILNDKNIVCVPAVPLGIMGDLLH